jgi:hypothetical protein
VLILCPNCRGTLPSWFIRTNRTESLCPNCYAGLTVEVFPALFRTLTKIDRAGLTLSEGEACCYEHATKRAVESCHRCGRFVCALCEVEIEGQVCCPSCLRLDKAQPAVRSLETHRTLYDSIALAVATWPALLFFYPSLLGSPVAIYLAVRYWKTPSSLIPRNKWRFVLALVIALSELCLLAAIVVTLFFAFRRGFRVQ